MAKGKVLKTIIDISGEISPTLGKSLNSVVDKLEGVNIKAIAVGASVAAIGGAVAVGIGTQPLWQVKRCYFSLLK